MPWHTCCKAILHGYLNGQAGASATLDILTGKVNPSGRLAETYPISYEQTPAFRYYPSNEKTSEYRESVYVGYAIMILQKSGCNTHLALGFPIRNLHILILS